MITFKQFMEEWTEGHQTGDEQSLLASTIAGLLKKQVAVSAYVTYLTFNPHSKLRYNQRKMVPIMRVSGNKLVLADGMWFELNDDEPDDSAKTLQKTQDGWVLRMVKPKDGSDAIKV